MVQKGSATIADPQEISYFDLGRGMTVYRWELPQKLFPYMMTIRLLKLMSARLELGFVLELQRKTKLQNLLRA